ncbi:MAG: ExbD/TolR family protein [Candidatus Eisenbacteria bacterium]|nr:ExbD/TolR family protein [Candidatus Eisenbacteria bacterium]
MPSHDYRPLSQVNVTSLVDVTLVLLIVFMLAAPLLQEGVEVELPRAEVKGIEMSDAWILSVDREGNVFLNERKIPMDRLSAEIEGRIVASGAREVYVRGDARVPYGSVVRLIGMLKGAGIEHVGLVSQPEEPAGAFP